MCGCCPSVCSWGLCRAAAAASRSPAAQEHDFTLPTPWPHAENDLCLSYHFSEVLWKPEENKDSQPQGPQRPCPWDRHMGDALSTPRKALTVRCGVSMSPSLREGNRDVSIGVFPSSGARTAGWPRFHKPHGDKDTQGHRVPGPAGGQRGAQPSLPSSPRTHHVEMKTPSSRKLMKIVFTRQLFSGVYFAKRPASRGELERFPQP